VEKLTDADDNDGFKVMTISHMDLWSRRAKIRPGMTADIVTRIKSEI